ncbi:MAG TPA: DUF4956 domain-containing protein [Longimicrobiales bacterium]|nr:DUF4956 domain-containing protein [Longimicrobiales bacterium]
MAEAVSRDAERPGGSPGSGYARAQRWFPVAGLLLYYAVVLGFGLALMRWVPGAQGAMVAPIQGGEGVGIFTGAATGATLPTAPWDGPFARLGLAVFALGGTLALTLPVAWVHMFTRRLRYDPYLVQTMIILPIVVAGVVLVVKNSLALAFALAGIVAGVRFRQKLNEPTEAAYMLLSLGIGLAAAVQALDVAFAVSFGFNIVVLGLYYYDLGTMVGLGPMLVMGDTGLLADRSSTAREELRERAAEAAEGMKTDGILVVHAADPDAARRGIEISLSGVAKEWRVTEPTLAENGLSRFEVLVRLKKKGDPVELLGELEERWSAHIAAAEYIPYRSDSDPDDGD